MDQLQELLEAIRYQTEEMSNLTEAICEMAKAVNTQTQLSAAAIQSTYDDEEQQKSVTYMDGTPR